MHSLLAQHLISVAFTTAVSELEYIKFMLGMQGALPSLSYLLILKPHSSFLAVAMRKIDASLFDELREQFVKLDMTGDGKRYLNSFVPVIVV